MRESGGNRQWRCDRDWARRNEPVNGVCRRYQYGRKPGLAQEGTDGEMIIRMSRLAVFFGGAGGSSSAGQLLRLRYVIPAAREPV